jgi:hypothetical protein
LAQAILSEAARLQSRDKTPGKSTNADNVKVPATVDQLLATMKVVPGPVIPTALAL